MRTMTARLPRRKLPGRCRENWQRGWGRTFSGKALARRDCAPLLVGVALILLATTVGASGAAGLPSRPGTCVLTKVASIGTRLEDGTTGRPIAGSGSAITFANRGYQVSYEEIPAISRSRKGDPVYMCLMRIPAPCPPGDHRGRIYTTTNLRTMEAWTLPDSEHSCGGA
jgi:hypothetical protein